MKEKKLGELIRTSTRRYYFYAQGEREKKKVDRLYAKKNENKKTRSAKGPNVSGTRCLNNGDYFAYCIHTQNTIAVVLRRLVPAREIINSIILYTRCF